VYPNRWVILGTSEKQFTTTMNTETLAPILRKTTGPDKTYTTSTPHRRIVLLKLECGHVVGMPLKPTEYECRGCKKHVFSTTSPGKCECGKWHYALLTPPRDEWDDSTYDIPAQCECEECAREAHELTLIPDLVARSVHSRFRPFGNSGYITFYAPDKTSPSGVRSIGGIAATKQAEELIRSINSSISPLSPTEGFRR
jgi:hypothetical protein